MLIELEKMVDLDQINPEEIIGESWVVFGESIPTEQYNILTSVLKLIYAIDESMTEVNALILNTFTNEDLDVQSKKLEIYLTLNNIVVELLEEMGIHLHEESRGFEHLHHTRYLLTMLLDIGSVGDAQHLCQTIMDETVDGVERLMKIMSYLYPPEFYGEVEYMIHEVNEQLFRTIAGVLTNDDVLIEGIPDSLIARVKANLIFMDETLGRQIITTGSAVEGSIVTFKTFFAKELEDLASDTSEEGITNYVNNMVSLYLVSSINTASLKERLVEEFTTFSDDILISMRIEEILNQLVLDV